MSSRTYQNINLQEVDGVLIKTTTVTTVEVVRTEPTLIFKPRIFTDTIGDRWYEQTPGYFDAWSIGREEWADKHYTKWSLKGIKDSYSKVTEVTGKEDWRKHD